MSTALIEVVKQLIEANPETVEFGSANEAVNSEWFDKAEKVLGVPLTESYVWFLKNYAGGEICGDEVFSIYGTNFEDVSGGDIVYHYLLSKGDSTTTPSELVFMKTDFDEIFFFNYVERIGNECPIYLKFPSGNVEYYAQNFYVFLQKRITEVLS